MAAIREAHEGRPPELPEQAVQALAGKYYQGQIVKSLPTVTPISRPKVTP